MLAAVTPIAEGGHYFAAARIDPNGAVDRSFGKDGFTPYINVAHRTGGDAAGVLQAESVAGLKDGKVLIAGYYEDIGAFAPALFTAKGRIDRSFGHDGRVAFARPGAHAIKLTSFFEAPFTVDSKGRIVLCVPTFPEGDEEPVSFVRLLPDGRRDTYGPCPTCGGARYNPETLAVTYRDRNIADVLRMTVDEAADFLDDVPAAARSLATLRDVGLGYLRLGQPATELSGGEAQRIKLATELQRARRGHTLYLLDEPTTGLHPADVELLIAQLHHLVDAGGTVVVVEHDLDLIASADWTIELGPGGGDAGGQIIATGTPAELAATPASRTGPYLAGRLP
jgi:ABC-type lipopolysaccharide export system ATPase subunit